jgi:hypothetical protein
MPFLLSLLGNRFVLFGLIAALISGGVWFKVHSLQSKLDDEVAIVQRVQADNATLKLSLQTAMAVNDSNLAELAKLQADQALAIKALEGVKTDLSVAKAGLADARKRIATKQASPVPPNIVDAVTAIQQARDQGAK